MGEAHARLSRIFALDSHLPANPFRHSFGHKAYFHWDYFLNRDFSGVLKTFADRVGDRYIDLVEWANLAIREPCTPARIPSTWQA